MLNRVATASLRTSGVMGTRADDPLSCMKRVGTNKVHVGKGKREGQNTLRTE